jgi:hypothetical protein
MSKFGIRSALPCKGGFTANSINLFAWTQGFIRAENLPSRWFTQAFLHADTIVPRSHRRSRSQHPHPYLSAWQPWLYVAFGFMVDELKTSKYFSIALGMFLTTTNTIETTQPAHLKRNQAESGYFCNRGIMDQ